MKITNNEIKADNGKYIARKGSNNYFVACTLLKGETEDNFVEITALEKEQIDINNAEGGLEDVRENKIDEIAAYDKSSAVNSFTYKGVPMWFDKADRVGLMNSLNIEKRNGKTDSTMWFGDIPLVVNIDEGLALLDAIELYALECYNVTARHKAEVNVLKTIEEINAYDITKGYPSRLEL